ncbi:MAG: DUF4956 domain-containing protein [Rikenellaceae bacterium]
MFQDLFIQLPNMFLMSSGEWLESLNFLGVDLVDFDDFAELLMRFVFNMSVLLLLVRGIYLYFNTRRNYSFSFIAVGGVVFLLCYLLNNVKLELGFALGLFAIFGIIRYRTDAIPFKQMTYLFVVIGVSVMNALASKKVSYAELLFTNFAVLSGLWLLERYLSRRQEGSMRIVYENIANINQQRYDELLQDLRIRTGFNIKHFEIDSIDYMRDSATVIVYFDTNDNSFSIDENN